MSLPKASIVSVGLHDQVLAWVTRYKPVSILVVNERGSSSPETPWTNHEIGQIRTCMATSPKTLWIFRSWPDGIMEGDSPLNYRVWKCFEPFMDMPNPKMGHSFNEPGFPWIQASGDARRLEAMETGFARYIHDQGLLSMNFCFSESHLLKGNLGLWNIFADALPYVDALGFNEYDKVGSDTWGELWKGHPFLFRLGHWEDQRERIISILGYCPPIILGEGLIDGKVRGGDQAGWSRLGWSPPRYVGLHQAVHDASYHKKGLFSHHTFCYCGEESEWHRDGYTIKPILSKLGHLVQNQVYWSNDQGGGSVGIWKNVPSQIAQWRPVIETVTSSFHVPIPPHNGVHLSPAKVLTVIIRRESEGKQMATNPTTGAAGLCQIMPFHFEPGQDPYEPEWNIRAGLEDLQRKLYPKSAPPREFQRALFYYGGKADRPWEPFIEGYWEPFVKWYKEFWGVDLEPGPEPNHIQEALLEIARAETKIGGMDYLLKQTEESLEAAIKMLSGEDT